MASSFLADILAVDIFRKASGAVMRLWNNENTKKARREMGVIPSSPTRCYFCA